MSKFPKFLGLTLALSLSASGAYAEQYGIGRVALPDEIAAWDTDVRPDGLGLPEGQGSALEGEVVYSERCAVCHGDFGEAVGRWPVLAGGADSLQDDRPVKTIGSYWPYLSTVWDYVHRAMPFGDAASLTPDETYAIVAYLLYVNDVLDDDQFVLSKENFLTVRLPNEGEFFNDDRKNTEFDAFTDACMNNCKDDVTITARAAVVDVTPEETKQRKLERAVREVAKNRTQPKTAAVSAATTTEEQPASDQETTEVAENATAETATSELDPALVADGEKVFKKCKACHQVGENAANRTGPHLNGVVDRAIGGVDGFKYSNAMKAKGDEGLVWDSANLQTFLEKPKSMVPGTKMSFSGLKKVDDQLAVIEYLRTFGE